MPLRSRSDNTIPYYIDTFRASVSCERDYLSGYASAHGQARATSGSQVRSRAADDGIGC